MKHSRLYSEKADSMTKKPISKLILKLRKICTDLQYADRLDKDLLALLNAIDNITDGTKSSYYKPIKKCRDYAGNLFDKNREKIDKLENEFDSYVS